MAPPCRKEHLIEFMKTGMDFYGPSGNVSLDDHAVIAGKSTVNFVSVFIPKRLIEEKCNFM